MEDVQIDLTTPKGSNKNDTTNTIVNGSRTEPSAMGTYTQILYHIVFSTKNRRRALTPARRADLLAYLWGALKGLKSHAYRINAVEDHLHILATLHPTVCLADLVKTLKVSSHEWIDRGAVFSGFDGWQEGYAAFTASYGDRDEIAEYIKSQEAHHAKVTFTEELIAFYKSAGIRYDERYLQ